MLKEVGLNNDKILFYTYTGNFSEILEDREVINKVQWIIDWINIYGVNIYEEKRDLNYIPTKFFISSLWINNRETSLSPHIDTLRDKSTKDIQNILLYNPWKVNSSLSSYTWLITLSLLQEIIRDKYYDYIIWSELPLKLYRNKIIEYYFLQTGNVLKESDPVLDMF